MTGKVVLDCSVAMAWCFEDETSAFTEAVLDAVVEGALSSPVYGRWKRSTCFSSASERNG